MYVLHTPVYFLHIAVSMHLVYAFYTTNGMPSGMLSGGKTDIYDSLSEIQTILAF